MKRLHQLMHRAVHSRYSTLLFALLVFVEPFFFVTATVLFVIYGIEWPRKALYFAGIATIATTAGAATAYGIGMLLANLGLDHILLYFIPQEKLHTFVSFCCQYQVFTVFFYSLIPAPLPFKLITIPAGFFKLPFIPFIVSVAAGRGLRYFIMGAAFRVWGDQIQKIVDRYFYHCIALILVLLFIAVWFVHR